MQKILKNVVCIPLTYTHLETTVRYLAHGKKNVIDSKRNTNVIKGQLTFGTCFNNARKIITSSATCNVISCAKIHLRMYLQ